MVGYWSELPDHSDFMVADAPRNSPLAAFLASCLPYGGADHDASAVANMEAPLQLRLQMQDRG